MSKVLQAASHSYSSYSVAIDGKLTFDRGSTPPRMAEDIHSAFRAIVHDPDFPCVGAKSVFNQGSYRFGLYPELGSEEATGGLASDLYRFIVERPNIEGDFTSFIASFLEPKLRSLKQFEDLLWRQLRALHELDAGAHPWNNEVSKDPASPNFSFSFGGHPFFIVGLAPPNPRWARRFPWPTLVFNDHFQFQKLREERRFEPIRDAIRQRDSKLHGSANPMLTDYGAHSEARQYSGRNVKSKWACPVQFE